METKFIILCGGIGKRNNNYSLPKPLNYIGSKHMIEYIIESIQSNIIYIIYNKFLKQYNFETIIINKFKNKKFYFSVVDYYTRGAVESAFIGCKNFLLDPNENIIFLDNDNLHEFPELKTYNNNFIGYSYSDSGSQYSFIEMLDGKVTNIREKEKISNLYCCGLYGFINIDEFNYYAKKLIIENIKSKQEYYFSELYKLQLVENKCIDALYISKTRHMGSFQELQTCNLTKPLRICFDLDNTLVTYPTIPGDYSSVEPIENQIRLCNKLKENGHTIIIYTARRMKTHESNVGKVIKDIGFKTFETLDKFSIQYDELIFGKPIADIYIDDRAINPYSQDLSYFGLFYSKNSFIHNKVPNNKYNQIYKLDNNTILKIGPESFMKGELYYYQNIPEAMINYFPKLICFQEEQDKVNLTMEYIDGIPLFFLYKNELVSFKIIDDLFDILNQLHSIDLPIHISKNNIYNNYFTKLESRFNENDYFFENSKEIFKMILQNLAETYDPKISGIIHGDFWFSNIILEYSEKYKLIDMKGLVDGIPTLNGDIYYDYGKLYQSICGYDLILNNCVVNELYIQQMKNYFELKCNSINLNFAYLKNVTFSLIFGTIHSIENFETKARVWKFLESLLTS